MSAWEIDQALLRRGVGPDERKQVLADLKEYGMIDDLRFAKAYVHDRDIFAPRSQWLLKQELKRKGISEDIAAAVFANEERQEGGFDDISQARILASKHERRLAGLDDQTYRRRLSGILARKGFAPGVIMKVLQEKGASPEGDALD